MMKAWTLSGIGDIKLCEADVPMPAKKEVRIKVSACGVCGSDIPRIYETGAYRMPLIPGHEFSGVVEGIGKDVSPYWMGKKVAVFPKIACGKCKECRTGHSGLCKDYDYHGSRRDGAFAEYVTVPMSNLLELSDNISFETAAMLEPMAVAANAFRTGCCKGRYRVSPDKPIAVCGLGTIGLLVVMFLKEAGYENVFVIGNKESQKNKAKAFGVPEERFCNSESENIPEWLKKAADGGVSVYFECVGKNETISYGMEAAAPKGRIVLVGNPYSDMTFSKDTYWKILRNQLRLYGIWNSTFAPMDSQYREGEPDDWNYVLRLLSVGRLEPEKLITHRFGIDELEEGLTIMRDKTEDYTKIMMVMDSDANKGLVR